MNKILERLVALSMTQVFLICGGVGGLYYYAAYNDGSAYDTQLNTLTQEETAEKAKQKETESVLKEEKRIKDNVGTLGVQFQEISKKLPTQLTKIDMNRQVTVFSQTSRVKLRSITPMEVIKKEIVDEVPVRIVIDEASFGEIALFVYQASISERLVRVKDFTIQPSGEKGKLRFEGTVSGFRLNADDSKKDDGVKK